MDAIDLLTRQHRRLERRLDALQRQAPVDAAAFFRAADELVIHVVAEEAFFFPAVKVRPIEHILVESLDEHLLLKRVLTDLFTLSPSDPRFSPRLQVLAEQLERHHEEEEEKLFPIVRRIFDAETLHSLGLEIDRITKYFTAAGAPRDRVLAQTVEFAPLPGAT